MPLVFSSADQSFIQSFQGVEPLYSTLESETLPVRDDLGLPPENRSQLMSNAALTEEDYFVAPPGNMPLSLSKSYTAWPFRVWWRLMVERLGCFGGSPSGCLPMSPGPMWLRWMGRRDTQGTDQSKPDCLIFPSEWVAYFFFYITVLYFCGLGMFFSLTVLPIFSIKMKNDGQSIKDYIFWGFELVL